MVAMNRNLVSNLRYKRILSFSLSAFLGAIAASVLFTSTNVHAGELTDVLDAFDYENNDPVDFNFEPSFRFENHTGTIAREAPSAPDSTVAETGLFAELGYERSVTAIDFDVRWGLYQDLEFNMTLPMIISDQRTLSFTDTDSGPVNRNNSTVYPTDNAIQADLGNPNDGFGTYHYFSVDNESEKRQGIGDLRIGLAWSGFNQELSPEYATLTFGFDYLAPTAKVATASNSQVGRGVHELQFWLAGSRQVFSFFEPYYGMRFSLPMAANDSLFDVPEGSTQQYSAPGMRGDVTSGLEVIMWEDIESYQRYILDLGFDFGYRHAGRDYSPLFDALGNTTCNQTTPAETGSSLVDQNGNMDGTIYDPESGEVIASGNAACAWIVQQPSNASDNGTLAPQDLHYSHDGITDVDSFTVLGGHAALNLQFSDHISFEIFTSFMTQSDHFLTSANTGENSGDNSSETGAGTCIDDDTYVSLNPVCGERNPYYNPTLDGVGRRFMMQSAFDFTLKSTLAFQF